MNSIKSEVLPKMTVQELILRQGWALAYSGVAVLYMDDGELQDNSTLPHIDFMRDAPELIQMKIRQRALKAMSGRLKQSI